MKSELVELKPLKPFSGSYPCSMSEADVINDVFKDVEVEIGGVKMYQAVKTKEARKRFSASVPFDRAITPDELALFKAGKLPKHLEYVGRGETLTHYPLQRTVHVPAEMAASLIGRELAERVIADVAD